MGGEHFRLRSLSRARRAKKNEFHAFLPSLFLVKEALIVAHHHLRLKLFDRFKRNADQNDDRRAAQRNVHRVIRKRCDLREQNGEQRHNTQQKSAEQCNS